MDLSLVLTIISTIFAIISLPASIDYYPRKFPIIKKFWYVLSNKTYAVQINSIKKYESFQYDLKHIKKAIHSKNFSVDKINIPNRNSMIIHIKHMQSNYKILFTEDYDKINETGTMEVRIILEGTVRFNYRSSNGNIEYLNTLSDLFSTIENVFDIRPTFTLFILSAYTSEINIKPLSTNIEIEKYKNCNIEIDKATKYIKISSDSINNIFPCLNSNIQKII